MADHIVEITEMVYGEEKMKYRQAKKVLDNMHNGSVWPKYKTYIKAQKVFQRMNGVILND